MTDKIKVAVQDKKDDDYVWICDYCGKEFSTKKKCDLHETKCIKRNFNWNQLFIIGTVLIVVLFIFFMIRISNADGDNIAIQTISVPMPTQTPIPSPIPTKVVVKNVDVVTSCSFDPRCKQAPMQMKTSICKKTVCCQLGLDIWAVALSMSQCKELQNKAMDIYNSIYKNSPPLSLNQYVPAVPQYNTYIAPNNPVPTLYTPTLQPIQPNQNADYSSICQNQYTADTYNMNSPGGIEGHELAQDNFDRCMQTGIAKPLKITKPTPTPTIIQGIWYGNLGPL